MPKRLSGWQGTTASEQLFPFSQECLSHHFCCTSHTSPIDNGNYVMKVVRVVPGFGQEKRLFDVLLSTLTLFNADRELNYLGVANVCANSLLLDSKDNRARYLHSRVSLPMSSKSLLFPYSPYYAFDQLRMQGLRSLFGNENVSSV